MRRVAVIVAAASSMATAALGTEVAIASSPIGPSQHFVGLINGKHTGAVIYTVCPGPGVGDGPVAGHQTVAVARVAAGGGDTGAGGDVIFARITPTTIVSMKRYGTPEPVPTSARVPCQGSGTVSFSTCPLPQPCGAGARTDDVPVEFINMGARPTG